MQDAPLAPPQMPVEMRREILDDAINATLGLLDLMHAALATPPTIGDVLACGARRSHVAALCQLTSHHLNEAHDQLGS